MANNASQTLKAKAVAARAANVTANATKYAALISRLTTTLVAEADKGRERYSMPPDDQDYKDWSSPVGLEYLKGPGRMLSAELVQYSSGLMLDISWENPKPDPT